MAWEKRKGRGHYYTTTRQIAGIRRRVYFGKGTKGRAAAELQRARRRQWWEAKAHTLEVASITQDYLRLSDAELNDAGYHRQKRLHWRRVRYGDRGMGNTRKRTKRTHETTLAQDARDQLIMSMCSDEQDRAKYRLDVERYEKELLAGSDGALERGLIQRIATCWLAVELTEHKHAAQRTAAGRAVWNVELTAAARRYLSAYAALSNTRRSPETDTAGWAGFTPEKMAEEQRSMLAKAYAVSDGELVMPSEHHERLAVKLKRAFSDESPSDEEFLSDEPPPDGAA